MRQKAGETAAVSMQVARPSMPPAAMLLLLISAHQRNCPWPHAQQWLRKLRQCQHCCIHTADQQQLQCERWCWLLFRTYACPTVFAKGLHVDACKENMLCLKIAALRWPFCVLTGYCIDPVPHSSQCCKGLQHCEQRCCSCYHCSAAGYTVTYTQPLQSASWATEATLACCALLLLLLLLTLGLSW